nr:hypothetical protein [Tanacetum cinerariifolium]
TLTPTKAESESDWWKTSLEYFKGKDVQSEAVSEQLEIEKDALSTITTLTKTVLSLQGSIGILESRLLALEDDARISTLTQTVSSLQGTIDNLVSRLLTLELLKDTKDAAKDVTKDVAKDTISVPMTITEKLKDTINIDAAAQDTFCTEDELQFIGMEKGDKPNYDLSNLSKIKRNKYPIYSTFEKKKTDCYLDCLPKGRTCEPSFWEILYPGGEKAEYIDEGKLDGLHINAFIELMMRKRPRNAQWALGLSELVAFILTANLSLCLSYFVDYPINLIGFFPINLDNKHWVAASWNLDDYVFTVYDSLESPENYEKIKDLLKIWKDFIKRLGKYGLV